MGILNHLMVYIGVGLVPNMTGGVYVVRVFRTDLAVI